MDYHAFFHSSTPLVMSHAGDTTHGAQSGSLDSYVQAWEKGFRCFQIDVVALANGELISNHAITGRKRAWESRSVAALRASDEQITTVDEILDAVPESQWNFEIKSRYATKALAELIARRPESPTRFLISSPFRPVILQELRSQVGPDLAIAASLIDGGLIGLPLRPRSVKADAVQLWKYLAKSNWILNRCAARGIHVQIWTLNSDKDIDDFVRRGVPGFITDNHDLAWTHLSNDVGKLK